MCVCGVGGVLPQEPDELFPLHQDPGRGHPVLGLHPGDDGPALDLEAVLAVRLRRDTCAARPRFHVGEAPRRGDHGLQEQPQQRGPLPVEHGVGVEVEVIPGEEASTGEEAAAGSGEAAEEAVHQLLCDVGRGSKGGEKPLLTKHTMTMTLKASLAFIVVTGQWRLYIH